MKSPAKRSVSKRVMKQIESGHIHMHSRLYFAALATVSVALIASLAGLVAYFISILFFWVRIQTADTMAWGARANLTSALGSFPWWVVLITIGTMAVTVWLVRKHGTMYRQKLTTITAIVVVLSFVIGYVVSTSGLLTNHEKPGFSPPINRVMNH